MKWIGIPAAALLALLAGLCTIASARADDPPRLFGKTNEQVLAMGRTAWMEFQGSKAGTSTADMVEGRKRSAWRSGPATTDWRARPPPRPPALSETCGPSSRSSTAA